MIYAIYLSLFYCLKYATLKNVRKTALNQRNTDIEETSNNKHQYWY